MEELRHQARASLCQCRRHECQHRLPVRIQRPWRPNNDTPQRRPRNNHEQNPAYSQHTAVHRAV